jgi:hypothetical protein
MSIIVDVDQELDEVLAEDQTPTEELEVTPEEQNIEGGDPTNEYEVPEKFKGKSLEDVVKSYTELEKEFGRKNNEVGELRSLADKLLQQELESKQTPVETKEVTFDDLVESPEDAVSGIVDNRVKELESKLENYNREAGLAKFQAKHTDYNEVGQDPKFQEWIKGSTYRTKMFLQADQNFDFDAADELLTEWKERQELLKQTSEAEVQNKVKDDLKKASAESGGTGETSKKIYSRSQLMNLRLNNPSKYEAMQDEIERAYAEGRVR